MGGNASDAAVATTHAISTALIARHGECDVVVMRFRSQPLRCDEIAQLSGSQNHRSALPLDHRAELAAGPHATQDAAERARRQDRLQRAEAVFDPLPFDSEASRAYGRVYAAVVGAGRKARGARAVDLLIAATALTADLPLYTRNPADFRALHDLIEVVAV